VRNMGCNMRLVGGNRNILLLPFIISMYIARSKRVYSPDIFSSVSGFCEDRPGRHSAGPAIACRAADSAAGHGSSTGDSSASPELRGSGPRSGQEEDPRCFVWIARAHTTLFTF
jgi:hypothetical protein